MPAPTPNLPGSSVFGHRWSELARQRRSRMPVAIGVLLSLVAGLSAFGLQRSFRADVIAQTGGRIFVVTTPLETVNANEPFDITVKAQSAGATDTAYLGTVKFSSPEELAFTIADYTYTSADNGAHTFSLAGTFLTPGLKTIEVVDAADPTTKGSATVEVKQAGTISSLPTGSAPVITSPATGTTVNQPSVSIRGTAAANAGVSLTDNDLSIGTATALADGSFTFEATNLASGAHRFVATANGAPSATVSITVQTAAVGQTPDLILSRETVAVVPNAPATSIDAQVLAEPGLKRVQLSLDQRLIDLNEELSTPGTYKGVLLAPTVPGSYPIDVLVESNLGAQQPFTALKTLVVTSDTSVQPGANTAPTVSFTFTPTSGPVPLTVTFTTVAADKEDGEPASYLWDFGDGATSTEKNPVHVYQGNGPYAPRVTARDSGGLEATAIANPDITATGPGMVAALLAVSGALAFFFQRRRTAA